MAKRTFNKDECFVLLQKAYTHLKMKNKGDRYWGNYDPVLLSLVKQIQIYLQRFKYTD
jgi:hypothetical protein